MNLPGREISTFTTGNRLIPRTGISWQTLWTHLSDRSLGSGVYLCNLSQGQGNTKVIRPKGQESEAYLGDWSPGSGVYLSD